MCGIINVIAVGTEKSDVKTEIMRFLFTELLQVTEERGKDATGMSALFTNGMSYIQKGPVTATELIGNLSNDEDAYNMFMKNCTDYTANNDISLKLLMGHCRKSSVGGAFNNTNNHPIKVNEIVGVHNGTLDNHEIIFNNLGCKRDGIVDSEAIMHLLDYYSNYCTEPFTIEGLEETARRLEGAYSVMAYNANNPYQLCMMRKERPFELALLKDLKIMLISSDKSFFLKALYQYNKMAYLFKDVFKPVKIAEVESFTLPLDNVGILDLTREIEEDTIIEDLITRKDIFKVPKIWQSPPKIHMYGKTYGYVAANKDKKNDTTKKEEDTVTIVPESATNTTFKGKIFSKKLNAYVDADTCSRLESEGPTIIEVGSDKVQTIDRNTLVDFTEDKNLAIKEVENPVPIIINEVKTVDDSLAEAMKASTEHSNFRTRFNTDEEIAETFNIKSLDTLSNIPSFALINKVRETIYKEAFIDGSLWFKENHAGSTGIVCNQTKAVRIAKQIVEIFGTVIEQLSDGKTEDFTAKIHTELQNRKNTELTLDNIRQVFSKGDTMFCKALVALEDVI